MLSKAFGPVPIVNRAIAEGLTAGFAGKRFLTGVLVPDVVLERCTLGERLLAVRAAVLPDVTVNFPVLSQGRRAAKQLAALRTDEPVLLRMGVPTVLGQLCLLAVLLAARFARKR